MNNQKILRLPSVIDVTGLSRSTIYAMLGKGKFPQSVKLSARSVGWYESDIQNWITERKVSAEVS